MVITHSSLSPIFFPTLNKFSFTMLKCGLAGGFSLRLLLRFRCRKKSRMDVLDRFLRKAFVADE